MDNASKRSGWITVVGVMALIAGGYNTLSGIAALSDDDTVASPKVTSSSPDAR